jgi:hypothetical protein
MRHAGGMSRYAEAKPYALPTSLAELSGPTVGTVILPRHIDWGPHYEYDLSDAADVVLMYERVIRESQTAADLHTYLNASVLRRVWPDLFLPLRARDLWQTSFPQLSTTRAAAA